MLLTSLLEFHMDRVLKTAYRSTEIEGGLTWLVTVNLIPDIKSSTIQAQHATSIPVESSTSAQTADWSSQRIRVFHQAYASSPYFTKQFLPKIKGTIAFYPANLLTLGIIAVCFLDLSYGSCS